MFSFDNSNNPEPFNIYLCKPNGDVMYQLNGIDEDDASITINLNNQYVLSFDYLRYINSSDNELVESNGYHNLVVGMKILVDKVGYFKIKYPPMKFDGSKEIKTVNAASVDCELEDKDLVGFKINTGENDSLEYLVTYEDGETESLLNDYTGLPYDYIVFYNTYSEQLNTILNKYPDGIYTDSSDISEIKSFCDLIQRLKRKVITDSDGNMSITEYVEFTYDSSGENIISIYLSGFNNRVSQLITFYQKYRDQLSLISLAIEKCNCNWTIGTIDSSLVNKKFQFDIDGKNIYSFLTDDISTVANCVFNFNLFKKEIDIVLAENIGVNSGVILDRYNLLNSLEVTCNSENIYTRYNVSGGNNIGIQYVNFGSTRIDDLSYFLNAKDENNKRIYVSDELAEKYEQFKMDRNTVRDSYIAFTKQYNQSLIDIDEIKYRVPNDSVKNDWDTFTDKELEESLVTYNQLLVTLQSLYKEDYGTAGCDNDGSINEKYIKNTEYWYDYYAYKITIEQIEGTIVARSNGIRYADIDDKTVLKNINAYKTEWSLYGIVELQNIITAYNNSMQVLVDGEAIILKPDSDEAKTWDDELIDSEKAEYGNLESNYQYNVYIDLYNERTSCQEYLDTLNIKLAELENIRDTSQTNRNELVKLVTVETYNRITLGEIVTLPPSSIPIKFTEDEIKTIHLLYMDTNYSNENILTTSLDTTVTEVDIQYELLQDAEEQLSIESQPQISFKADVDNLFCLPAFKDFDFTIGNYVTVEYYDDYYVNLRLSSMSFNPCVPENSLTVSFTNFIKSKSERSDVSYILNQTSGGSSSSSSTGSGNSGSFGDNKDIDVTISNIMLAKLLNTEMFGTRVSNIILDTIKVNEITAKYAKFDGLSKGTTIIDGKCITTGYIIDKNYNGKDGNIENNKGSIINLETGQFNFGGGSLKYDGNNLNVKGAIYADIGYIGGESGFTIAASKLYSNSHSAYNTAKDGVYIGTDYISLGNGGVTYFSSDGTGKIGSFNIRDSYIANKTTSLAGNVDSVYVGIDGVSCGTAFKVTSVGALTCTGATISGTITATGGTIGGFTIDTFAIYNGTSSLTSTTAGVYIGTNGIRTCGTDGYVTHSTYYSQYQNIGDSRNIIITGDGIGLYGYTSGSTSYPNQIKFYKNGVCQGFIDEEYLSNAAQTLLVQWNGLISAVSLTTSGSITATGNIYGKYVIGTNNNGFYCENTSGTNVQILNVTSSDNCVVGSASLSYLVLRGTTVKLSSTTGTTVTSDERLKNSFKGLGDYEEFFMDLDPCAFKYNNGTSGRYHIGFKAQQVRDALTDNNLYSTDFAGYIKMNVSPDDDEYNGFTDELGLIYTEFTALNTYMIQNQQKKLITQKAEMEELETKLENQDKIIKILCEKLKIDTTELL